MESQQCREREVESGRILVFDKEAEEPTGTVRGLGSGLVVSGKVKLGKLSEALHKHELGHKQGTEEE
jgi:hypothetical protein